MKNILKRILLVILWFFFVMFIIGTITTNEVSARAALAILGGIILLLILKIRSPKKQQLQSNNNELLLQQQLQKISILEAENSQLKNKLNEIGCNDYDAVQKVITLKQHEIDTLNSTIAENNAIAERQLEKNQVVTEDSLKLEKKYASLQAKVTRLRYLFDAITQAINDYHDEKDIFALTNLINEADELSPSVILKLHNMDYKDLKKAFNENDKAITQVLEVYEKRYTTKANQSIYQLMVIALRAELQNILYNLKYDKLDKSIDDIKLISAKYLKIAGEGNQSISSTLTRFIGESQSNCAKFT